MRLFIALIITIPLFFAGQFLLKGGGYKTLLQKGFLQNKTVQANLINDKPMAASTELYERKNFQTQSGFNMTYFMLEPYKPYPENLDLPLIVLLHGGTGRAYAGEYLAQPKMRLNAPAFVIAPVTPKNMIWALPDPQSKNAEVLPYVIELVKSLENQYPIDKKRIYVLGCSMGGHGTFGAIARYPDVFAAGVAISGAWNPLDAKYMLNTPLLILHGARDDIVPVSGSRNMVKAIKMLGGQKMDYNEFPKWGTNARRRSYIPRRCGTGFPNKEKKIKR